MSASVEGFWLISWLPILLHNAYVELSQEASCILWQVGRRTLACRAVLHTTVIEIILLADNTKVTVTKLNPLAFEQLKKAAHRKIEAVIASIGFSIT